MFEPERFGKYLLLDKIATGGMAEVYKAKSYGVMGFEKLLVIKKILPHLSRNREFVSMFINEAKVSVSLNHANIVQVYDLGVVGTDYYIAMEYIHGPDLMRTARRAIKRRRPLPIPLTCFIVSEMARGLDYAHNLKDPSGRPLNVVHRDISPHNVLLSYEGDVKLVDFGIAQVGKDLSGGDRVAAGKYAYMSPEHLGVAPVDPRSDIYSTGIVLFELSTGMRLYAGMSVEQKRQAILEGTVPKPSTVNPGIDPALEQIIFTALARDPQFRYQSALDLQEALIGFLFESGNRVSRIDLSSFLKEIYQEEYQQDTAAGSVINNFEPEFDRLAGSQPSSPSMRTGDTSRELSQFTSGSLGSMAPRRRWTARQRGATNASQAPAVEPPRRRRPRPASREVSETSALSGTPSLDSGTLEAADVPRLERLAEGERREVYVLAADVVGFDAISENLDEEDLLRFNYRYLRGLVQTVRRYKGALDRFYNDRFLVFWGLARSGEHDLDLCLDCAQALADLGERFRFGRGLRVDLCVGIHRGTLVAGRKGRRLRRFVPLGDTLKLAMRLGEAAEPGQVLVSDRVASQAAEQRLFDVQSPLHIKGRRGPVRVHLLGGKREIVRDAVPSGRWIQRGDELERLDAVLRRVADAETICLVIRAEPGAGKTRFLQEILRRSREEGFRFLLGRGRFHRGREPLRPIADVVRQLVGIDGGAPEQAVRDALTDFGNQRGLDDVDVHLLGALLGVQFPASPIRYLAGDQRNADLLRLLARLLRDAALRQPMVMAFQAIDATDRLTVEFLRLLRESTIDAPLLLVMTAVAETDIPRRREGAPVEEIVLPGWGSAEIDRYTREFLDVDEAPERLVEFLQETSDGNALYVKELLRALTREEIVRVGEDGRVTVEEPLRRSSVPDTVQDLVASRLDALERSQRLVIEVASVVGRTFSLAVIARAMNADVGSIEKAIDDLAGTDLLRPRRADQGGDSCQFRNPLTWEVTYRGIIAARRKELHARVGEAIEALFPDDRDHLEVLTEHFKKAGMSLRAARYAERAGLQRRQSGYVQDATRCFQQAVLLLRGAGDEADDRTAGRMLSDVYARLGDLALEGGDAREARRQANMALDYAADADADPQEARALMILVRVEEALGHDGQATAYRARLSELLEVLPEGDLRQELRITAAEWAKRDGRLEEAATLLQEARSRARESGDEAQEVAVLCEQGEIHLRSGSADDARDLLMEALRLGRRGGQRGVLGRLLCLIGDAERRRRDLDASLTSYERAYRLYKGLDDREGMASCLLQLGDVHMRLNDHSRAARYLRRSMTMAEELGWNVGQARNDVAIGHLRCVRGTGTQGAAQIERGIAAARELGDLETVSRGSALLARCKRRMGDVDTAESLEEQARAIAQRIGYPSLMATIPD